MDDDSFLHGKIWSGISIIHVAYRRIRARVGESVVEYVGTIGPVGKLGHMQLGSLGEGTMNTESLCATPNMEVANVAVCFNLFLPLFIW